MTKQEKQTISDNPWLRYAPPLSNKLEDLEEAFNSLFPIVRFCSHMGSRAKFLEECIHPTHTLQMQPWKCPCCQSRRFRNIFSRYVAVCSRTPYLPTALTGEKINNRAYGFSKRKGCLYFNVRRHPRVDREYYMETEQRWLFNPQNKELIIVKEKPLGECSAII